MSGCLPEEALVLAQAGEGTRADREHLAACSACDARYRRLIRDLEMIGQALADVPPPGTASRHPAPGRYLVPAAAAGLVVAGVLLWGLWLGKATGPGVAPDSSGAEVTRDLQAVSATLFSALETSPTMMTSMADLDELQAALEWEASCRWAPVFTPECEDAQDYLLGPGGGEARERASQQEEAT